MKRFIKTITIFYFIFLILLWLMPFWPAPLWWIANVIQLGPLYLLFFPAVVLLIISVFLRLWKPAVLQILSILIVLLGIMKFQLNVPAHYDAKSVKPNSSIRVLSMNIGKDWEVGRRFNIPKFIELLKDLKPDVIALQEAGDPSMLKLIQAELPHNKWYGAFSSEFSLISKMKISEQHFGWEVRDSAGKKFLLKNGDNIITFFNVHFMTPRFGLNSLGQNNLSGVNAMKKITGIQANESDKAKEIAGKNKNVIIAGDFNQTLLHPIYQKNWSGFQNAFSKKGVGFGRTKCFPFYGIKGIRIDHILCDSAWKVVNAFVGPSLDCDHRPVIADLRFIKRDGPFFGKLEPFKKGSVPFYFNQKKEELIKKLQTNYHFENFDSNTGIFKAENNGKLSVDFENIYLLGNSLKAEALKAFAVFDQWDFKKYNNLSFSYRIPEQVNVCLKVKTSFDDTICLGAVTPSQCGDTKTKNFVKLTADDNWHELNVNVDDLIKPLLPNLKFLKEIQFTIDQSIDGKESFWIDDFIIYSR